MLLSLTLSLSVVPNNQQPTSTMTFKTTKLKNNKLKSYYELIKNIPPLKNSIKASYAWGRTLRKWHDAYEEREKQWKVIFARNFGEGGIGSPLHANWNTYQKEVRVLDDLDVDVEYMEFAEDDLKLEDGDSVAPAQFEAILWMMKENPSEVKPVPIPG